VGGRYAELTATCLALHASPGLDSLGIGINTGGEDMLMNDVKTLTREVIGLLQRLAERQRGPKEKAVFLINNYDQVLNVFHERRVDGEERQRFEDCLSQQRCGGAHTHTQHALAPVAWCLMSSRCHPGSSSWRRSCGRGTGA
jgi:hypothetical protein